MPFLGVLMLNTCIAGLGISLSRRRWSTRPVRTSAAALILSTTAFALVLFSWLQASN